MLEHDGKALVQFLAQLAYLLSALGGLFLLPAISNGFQQCDACGRGSQDDLLGAAVLDQLMIILDSSAEEGLARQVHDHDLGGPVKLVPVCLRTEHIHMVPDTAYVVRYGLLPLVFRSCGDHAHKSVYGGFGINYDLPTVWK